jgi:hypothetical protein
MASRPRQTRGGRSGGSVSGLLHHHPGTRPKKPEKIFAAERVCDKQRHLHYHENRRRSTTRVRHFLVDPDRGLWLKFDKTKAGRFTVAQNSRVAVASTFVLALLSTSAFGTPAVTTGTITVPSSGSTILNFNAGDTVVISGALSSLDAGENGGSPSDPCLGCEPFIIQQGSQVLFTLPNYNQFFSFSFVVPQTGPITFFTRNGDGDEGPSRLNYSLNPGPNSPAVQNSKNLNEGSFVLGAASIGILACAAIPGCLEVAAGAVGATALATGTGLVAVGSGLGVLGLGLNQLATDPIDFNYTTVQQPSSPTPPPLPAQIAPIIGPVDQTIADAIGVVNAIQTAFNRAVGAYISNAPSFEQLAHISVMLPLLSSYSLALFNRSRQVLAQI